MKTNRINTSTSKKMSETQMEPSERLARLLEQEIQSIKKIEAYIKRVDDLLAVLERQQGLNPRKIDPFALVKRGGRSCGENNEENLFNNGE